MLIETASAGKMNLFQMIRRFNFFLKSKLWRDFPRPLMYYKQAVETATRDGLCVLHAGGGRNKHNLFQGRRITRINVDLDYDTLVQDKTAALRTLANLEKLPVAANCVDLILCEMVFEHVAAPEKMIGEFYRCLKPNGRIFFITPNFMCYPYLVSRLMPYWFHKLYGVAVGRKAEDIFPTHYRLNTIPAIQQYFSRAGFDKIFLKQLDTSSDYLALLPGIYLLAVLYSRLISGVEALSFLRQFHVGCFRKP